MALTVETRVCSSIAPAGPGSVVRGRARKHAPTLAAADRLGLLGALALLASACPSTPVPPEEDPPDAFSGAAVACNDVLDACGAERFDCDGNPGDLIGMTADLSEACGRELTALYDCGLDNDCTLVGRCDAEDGDLLDCAREACRADADLDGCSTGGEGEGEGEGEGCDGGAIDDSACLEDRPTDLPDPYLCDGSICVDPNELTANCAGGDGAAYEGGPIVLDVTEVGTGSGDYCATYNNFIATVYSETAFDDGLNTNLHYINAGGDISGTYSETALLPSVEPIADAGGYYVVDFYLCGDGGAGAIHLTNNAGDGGNSFCMSLAE